VREERLDLLAQRDELPMVVVHFPELVFQDREKPHLEMDVCIAKRGRKEGMGFVTHS